MLKKRYHCHCWGKLVVLERCGRWTCHSFINAFTHIWKPCQHRTNHRLRHFCISPPQSKRIALCMCPNQNNPLGEMCILCLQHILNKALHIFDYIKIMWSRVFRVSLIVGPRAVVSESLIEDRINVLGTCFHINYVTHSDFMYVYTCLQHWSILLCVYIR